MTRKLIRRGSFGMLFVLLSFVLSSFTVSDIQARGRQTGSVVKKASQSIQSNNRGAKLSKNRRATRFTPLTATEKPQIIEKTTSLATAEVIPVPSAITNADEMQPADIAQAAKEELEEDDSDI